MTDNSIFATIELRALHLYKKTYIFNRLDKN